MWPGAPVRLTEHRGRGFAGFSIRFGADPSTRVARVSAARVASGLWWRDGHGCLRRVGTWRRERVNRPNDDHAPFLTDGTGRERRTG